MKKIFNQALPLIVASLLLSGLGEGWKLINSEIQFHREVRADIAAIKTKLGIEPTNESETHVATRN